MGNTIETDILGAVQMAYRIVLVLSGGTRGEDLKHFAYQPDLIVEIRDASQYSPWVRFSSDMSQLDDF